VISVAAVVGTRPEIIKISSLLKALDKGPGIHIRFIHTGQHFDWNMSQVFIKELGLPKPESFLGIGSATNVAQFGTTMTRLERHLAEKEVDWLVVVGDTNSVAASAVASAKLHIPVAHVEAGCRCYDPFMQEELNRRLVSECSTLNFTPTENCSLNLMREGIPLSRIAQTGHPIVEVVRDARRHMSAHILDRLDLEPNEYVFTTLHRAENVDDPRRLKSIIISLGRIGSKIVLPVHPRTRHRIMQFGLGACFRTGRFVLTQPLKYTDTLTLIENAAFAFTDSGGVQQESLLLGTPCLTARNTTEWVETLIKHANTLVDASPSIILHHARFLLKHSSVVRGQIREIKNPFGDGKATQRILRILSRKPPRPEPMNYLKDGIPTLRKIRTAHDLNSQAIRLQSPYINMVFKGKQQVVPYVRQVTRGQTVLIFGPEGIINRITRSSEVGMRLGQRRRHST
jgi:UDP-N-acetylglucosamine 2-epimerase (non-hydrolysing)